MLAARIATSAIRSSRGLGRDGDPHERRRNPHADRCPIDPTRLVLALVSGVQFMVMLDLAVVNVAIPSIQADLGLAQADLQWVVVTYGVTLGGFLLLGGRAADLLGRRRMLVAGLALFAAASLGAGLSDSLGQLVASGPCRASARRWRRRRRCRSWSATFAEGPARTKALGVFAAVSGTAASFGVIASGVLTDGPGWEWIFLVNVPIGVVLVALVLRRPRRPRRRARRRPTCSAPRPSRAG